MITTLLAAVFHSVWIGCELCVDARFYWRPVCNSQPASMVEIGLMRFISCNLSHNG